MSGFMMTPLGELAKFINGDRGKNYPSKSHFVDNGVPFINAGHLTDGEVDFSEMNYITAETFHKLGSGKTKKGDLLYCLRGSLGKTAIVRYEGDAAIASSLVIIRPSEKASVEYLYRYLTSPLGEAEINRFDNGSSQPNLSATSVKKYEIPLPPLGEQKRIAAILDAADALRAKRRESLAQLDTLLQSTFLDMFGDPVTNPKGWKELPLTEGLELINGRAFKSTEWSDNGLPIIRIQNVKDPDETFNRFEGSYDKRHLVRRGDVLICWAGQLVSIGVFRWDRDEGLLNQHIFKVIPRFNSEPGFLTYMLGFIIDQAKRGFRGIEMKHLTKSDLSRHNIVIPPLDLQRCFSAIVESIEQHKTRMRTHLEELDTLFASLQHRAFNGEL